MPTVTLTINGKKQTGNVEPRTLLVQFLREHLGLTGTHVGCDTSQCGACVVMIDGYSAKSCTMLATQVDGAEVTTIEGLAKGDELHPMQAAFREHHGLQCGFCTPGMLTTLIEFLRDNPNPTEEEVRVAISGNLCRCTGYQQIVEAVRHAAALMRGETGAP
jgi:carbon-monoxide dehydrogenase small subunit